MSRHDDAPELVKSKATTPGKIQPGKFGIFKAQTLANAGALPHRQPVGVRRRGCQV
jgi:hypothetical protein